MMTLIFLLFLFIVVLAWRGYRRAAQYGFGLTLVLALIEFQHHILAQLAIQL